MFEEQTIDSISKADLINKIRTIIEEGYRLVQIGCTRSKDVFVIDYSFDKELKFYGLRLELPIEQAALPSISDVCFPAFLYENEMHDLFGIKISGICVDYQGKFYRTGKEAPFNVSE